MIWLTGHSSAGKTFIGDYLATRGWAHVNGDEGAEANDERNPHLKPLWGNIFQCIMTMMQKPGEKVDEKLWKPYYEYLIEEFKKAMNSGKNVVLTFALLNMFDEMDWIREQLPGLEIVAVHVDDDVLLERMVERNQKLVALSGSSFKEMWDTSPLMKEAREMFGEFSIENYRSYVKAKFISMKLVKVEKDDSRVKWINNNDLKNSEGVRAINEIVGLGWEDIDQDAIA